jgi:hypothetical protein
MTTLPHRQGMKNTAYRHTRGLCYDYNFLQFSTIFGQNNWRFSQKMLLSNICIIYLDNFVFSRRCQFFSPIFWRKYLKK